MNEQPAFVSLLDKQSFPGKRCVLKEREDFAVKLRNDKRRELIREKRAFRVQQQTSLNTAQTFYDECYLVLQNQQRKLVSLEEYDMCQVDRINECFYKLTETQDKDEPYLALSEALRSYFINPQSQEEINAVIKQTDIMDSIIKILDGKISCSRSEALKSSAIVLVTALCHAADQDTVELILNDHSVLDYLVQNLNPACPDLVADILQSFIILVCYSKEPKVIVHQICNKAYPFDQIYKLLMREAPISTLVMKILIEFNQVFLQYDRCYRKSLKPDVCFEVCHQLGWMFTKLQEYDPYMVQMGLDSIASLLVGATDAQIKKIVSNPHFVKIFEFLSQGEYKIVWTALRVIGNLSTSTHGTEFALAHNCLNLLNSKLSPCNLTSVEKFNIANKQVLWILANIAVGPDTNQEAILNCEGLFDKALSHLNNPSAEVRDECVLFVCNLFNSSNTENQVKLVQMNSIQYLANLAVDPSTDCLLALVKSFDNFLKLCTIKSQEGLDYARDIGLKDYLDRLSLHSNLKISKQSLRLLEAYFTEHFNI